MIVPPFPEPGLTALNQFGTEESVSDYLGQWCLVWWYPKAMTPGCTSCGRAFQQALYDFQLRDCAIIGVSYDSPENNYAFSTKYSFDFPLLSATKEDAERWNAMRDPTDEWADYPRRVSYLINPDGVIVKSYKVGDTITHPRDVLYDLDALQDECPKSLKGKLLDLLRHKSLRS